MRTNDHKTTKPSVTPVPVGAGSRSGRGGPRGPFDFEVRVRLTPTQARLLHRLPIVGDCVRHWRVPTIGDDWRPHPTTPGIDIQLGAI